jgi:Zn-dependent peptidase ImmA (M78 family)/transcriptional regulator with XRE-family HTH domain
VENSAHEKVGIYSYLLLNLLALTKTDDMNSEVNPNMIVLARESRGQTQQDLAEKLKLHRANVSRLEKGETNIHDEILMAISAATCYPPQFFTQSGIVIPVNLAYRKRQQVPIKLLTPIEAKMNIIRRNVQFVTRALDKEIPMLPTFEVMTDQTPSVIAGLVRKQWNVAEGIVEDLLGTIERQGIIVSSFDFGTERVDSRSMFTDDKYPIIFLNKHLLGDRLRYSLAYELGQLIMHTFSSISPQRDISREANEFAAAFLMPEEIIKKDLENGITLPLLAELKRKWKVSMISILYRADDLGLLTPNQKRYLIQQFNEQKIRRREPVELDVPLEKPALLKNLINYYISEYEIGIKEMTAIFAIPLEDYLDYYGEREHEKRN